MSVDQRIREGLLLTNTELTEPDTLRALESVTSRARMADQRRRWAAIGAAVAVAATAAGVLVLAPRLGDDGAPTLAGRPSTSASASASAPDETTRIIAEGRLVSYGADSSGAVLTLWKSGSSYAWSLLRDGQPQATGRANLAGQGIDQADSGEVYPGGGGFVVSPAFETSNAQGETTFVAADGTVTVLTSACGPGGPPAGAPGRYVVTQGNSGVRIVDTVAGTYCEHPKVAGHELIETETVFAGDGTLWAVTDGPDPGGQQWSGTTVVSGATTTWWAEATTWGTPGWCRLRPRRSGGPAGRCGGSRWRTQ